MTESTHRVSSTAIDNLLVDTSPYLSCDDCFDRIDIYVERLLADPQHQDVPMRVHLAACGVCAEEAETLMELISDEPR